MGDSGKKTPRKKLLLSRCACIGVRVREDSGRTDQAVVLLKTARVLLHCLGVMKAKEPNELSRVIRY